MRALSILFLICFTPVSFAGLINVSSIKITSSINTYIQVSEVVATETGSGLDLALATAGATAHSYQNIETGVYHTSHAIDGVVGGSQYYHSYYIANEFLAIDLAAPSELDAFTISGRTVHCCSERDIYNIEFFDANGTSLYLATSVNANNANHSATIQLPDTTVVAPVTEPSLLAIWFLGLLGLLGKRYCTA